MKLGLTSSIALHAAILGWAFLSLSAPKPLDMSNVEALPVDVVPLESVSHVQIGDKKAAMHDKPAPKPTAKPKVVEEAQNAGDNKVDLKTPPAPKPSPTPIQTAEQPKAEPQPTPQPQPEPKPAPKEPPPPAPEPQPAPKAAEPEPPAPAPQVAKQEPPQEVKPDAVAQAIASDSPDAPTVKLPDNVPAPQARPEPPKTQLAEATPDKKTVKEPPAKPAPAKTAQEDKSLNDQIAALLNHEKSAGGGALRSDQTASLGGDTNTGGEKLSQSELDALRAQIQKCWNPPVGVSDAKNLKISIKMHLDPSGALEAEPQVVAGGGDDMLGRVAAESAMRAVMRCAPYKLPADKYQTWADVIVNFDPSQMF